MINNVVLGATPANITLHCKSKDEDLGFHTLEFLGNYMFSFKPTLIPWQTTLFFCSFAWSGSPYLHYFNIYDNKRDDCKTCNWKIYENMTCKYLTERRSFNACWPWNSVKLMDAYNTSKI
ncbi:putative plant self-incompatibility S1 [Medicago truncatula]|nr:putative plant self-incompatibility S1 [Medicago truncatula]